MNTPITGYRDLTEEEVALINEIKAQAESVRFLVQKIQRHAESAMAFPGNAAKFAENNPLRWVAIAQTDLQTGFMALTRAVARPTTF